MEVRHGLQPCLFYYQQSWWGVLFFLELTVCNDTNGQVKNVKFSDLVKFVIRFWLFITGVRRNRRSNYDDWCIVWKFNDFCFFSADRIGAQR
jgi:hypothetical protein